MRNFKIALVALFVLVGLNNMNAQDKNNPWAINFGVNAIDYHPTNYEANRTDHNNDAGWFEEYFNLQDHYNIVPALSSVSVGRYLNDGFSLEIGANLNKITVWGNSDGDFPEVNPGDLAYLGLEGTIKYKLQNLFGADGWFDPYLGVGGGYNWIDWDGSGTLDGAFGLNLWFSESIALNVQTKYKHSFDELFMPFFQHNLGLSVKFGGTDTDGDGIFDDEDACPETFGLEAFMGCPDTDGDGIKDGDDACPEVAGPVEFNGCPDTDGDGIVDVKDDCPTVKGLKEHNGCPDADGDGLIDSKDNCPKEAGPKANKGCPWPDTDGDGILDKDDKCPKVAGLAELKGCPAPKEVITVEAQAELDAYAKTIYFNSAKSTFKAGVTEKLDAIAAIMKEFDRANFLVEGHTDSQGASTYNQGLSEKRAGAVVEYLIGKGVASSRLSSVGFGEDYPVADNKSAAGRAENRRVEIKLRK